MSNAIETFPEVERLPSSIDAVEAFQRLSGLPHVVYFDSALKNPQLGRYSFVAADPVEWLTCPADGSDALGQLSERLQQWNHLTETFGPQTANRNPQSELPPFQGGWAGLIGYELGKSLERIPAAAIDEFHLPALAMGLYDVVLAFDHQQNAGWIISQGIPETDQFARRERAAARLLEFRQHLQRNEGDYRSVRPALQEDIPIAELGPQHPVSRGSQLTSNFSADNYQQAIRRAIEYIHAGDIFQVNLSQRLIHPATTPSVDLYCHLRARNPAPFSGYLDGGDWQVISASPERFIRVDGRDVETRPIKGTRGRTRRPEADLFSADELKASVKDRAENVMIVDLLRNDLSRTCAPESVRISQLCGLESYEYVQHLVSVVEGTLRNECTLIDLLRSTFPGGSVTGAPKIRAMEIIAELEPTVRGAYCGSLAYIGLDGRMDTSILIRTITAARGWWQLPVGGAIVAQSDPRDEYNETWHKAAGLLKAISP